MSSRDSVKSAAAILSSTCFVFFAPCKTLEETKKVMVVKIYFHIAELLKVPNNIRPTLLCESLF